MKVSGDDGMRRTRIAVGVLAASMLASVLGPAPAAHAEPYTIEVEGCDAADFVTAVEQANDSPVDVIVLDDKCRYQFEHGYFDTVLGEFTPNALPVITDDLIIYGNKSKVVGDGDDDGGGFRFLETSLLEGASTVEIRDLTVSGFELSVIDPFRSGGGAIMNLGSDLTLRNSTVKDNEVQMINIDPGFVFPGIEQVFLGGGVANFGGSVTIRGTTISGNEVNVLRLADGVGHFVIGGGVGSIGGAGIDIAGSTVKGNKVNAVGITASSFGAGGGLVVANELPDLQGPVLLAPGPGPTAELTMDGTSVSGNSVSTKSSGGTSSEAGAGGIYLDFSAFTHEIARSTVSGNRASSKGGSSGARATAGGIFNANDPAFGVPGLLVDDDTPPASADIQNVDDGDRTSILNNRASCDGVCTTQGGGYANGLSFEGVEGSAEFHRTVFKGNVADGDDGMGLGGGLFVIGDGAGAPEVVLDHATVTKNTAKGSFARGGGIRADQPEDVDLDESDIFKNKPDDCWAPTVGDFCDFS